MTMMNILQQMSFILQSELDKPYILKLCQEIKLIKQSKIDWTVDHVLRFADLIKIEDSIKDIITSWEIDGNKLFDVEYLNANLDCLITQRNYMPFYKLFYVVNAILEMTEGKDREPAQKQHQDFMNYASAEETEIDIPEQTIARLIEQLQRMNNMNVIELGTVQLSRLLKSVHLVEQSQSVLKWAVDGFSLLCIIGNQHYNQTYKNYYSNQNLKLLNKISHIFIHIYYYQHHQKMQQEAMDNLHPVDQFDVEFNDLNFAGKSFHSSQFGTSEPGEDDAEPLRNSEYVTSVRGSQAEFRNSEFVESVRGSMVKSEVGSYIEGSVRGSIMQSVRGSIMQSVRGSMMESVRGSVMESVRGSMRQSIRESMQEDNSTHESSNRGNSSNESPNYLSPKTAEKQASKNGKGDDKSIIEILMQASLKLPFNLLNLEPLQKIKISSIPYPFNLYKATTMSKKDTMNSNNSDLLTVGDSSSQRSQSLYDMILEDEEIREFKVFNLTGAKFGRSPENDFSYPDELSISGRHAQIVFKDESYYIRDLGSKTGTFVYISQRKPLVLSDEQLVQLSYQVEFKVIIIKNDINEGIIKFQFKKPQNEPPYRAILKNNNTVRFGKAQNSHIKLNNQSISSYHAQIKFQEGKFIMYDCNTRTGTWLRLSSKGVRSADRKLSKMDIIRISSKKTFLVQDMTEGVEFLSCCELGKGGRFDDC